MVNSGGNRIARLLAIAAQDRAKVAEIEGQLAELAGDWSIVPNKPGLAGEHCPTYSSSHRNSEQHKVR
jgi:hypothetical protein